MAYRQYCVVSGILFCLVALVHLLRILYGVPVLVGEYLVPMGLSWIAFAVPATLAFWAFRLTRLKRASS
jgi:hypothetical protein